MTSNRKKWIVAAAVAGLLGGAVAKAKVTSDAQAQKAGKNASCDVTCKNACNGCGGKTNSVSKS